MPIRAGARMAKPVGRGPPVQKNALAEEETTS